MDVTELIPRPLHPQLLWLGKQPRDWLKVMPGERPWGDDRPRTDLRVHPDRLGRAALAAKTPEATLAWDTVERAANSRHLITLAYLEAAGRLLADGPKLFAPSEEQWESAEQIEIHLHPSEFRSPYEAFVVQIPREARKRLAAEFGVDINRMPSKTLVRFRNEPGERSFIFVMSKFGAEEMYHVIQDQEGNPTLEDALLRMIKTEATEDGPELPVKDSDPDFLCHQRIGRAVLNLSLLLVHYGHRLGGPTDPKAWDKHRRKKHLAPLAAGDFLSIHMTQNVVIRQTAQAPPGTGASRDGGPVKPHWRRGHWRAKAGFGEARAAGHQVPLVFVRPTLVRPDRVVGDLAESEATYRG